MVFLELNLAVSWNNVQRIVVAIVVYAVLWFVLVVKMLQDSVIKQVQ